VRDLVIYHAGCADGWCSAWLFSHALPEAELYAAHYGTAPPDCTGRRVFLVDFSYKRPAMRQILSQAQAVTVLDHHASAEKELAGLVGDFTPRPGTEPPTVLFDMAKSGARLAWEYLYRRKLFPAEWQDPARSGFSPTNAPWLVDYTEDRDLWRWQLAESRAVNAALRLYPFEIAAWDRLYLESFTDLVPVGRAVLRRDEQIVADHVRHAREIILAGHRVLAVNATVLVSEIAGELAKGRRFGVCYFDRHDGVRVWSLRSDENGLDVSEIARSLGGGGHPRAAGFEETNGPRPAAAA
jgi:uncharacterized protein